MSTRVAVRASVVAGLTLALVLVVPACNRQRAPAKGPQAPISLVAAEPTDLRSRADALVQPLVDQGWIIGAAIALLHDGEVTYLGYGQIAADDARRPTPDTVFELGQVSKVFTALALADLVASEKLDMDTPVKELLPPGVTAPRRDGKDITLAQLASHTSGLPRMPDNFAPADPANPYADYSEAMLYQAVSQAELVTTPGEAYLDSNFGAGLLGEILARFEQRSYQDLMIEHVAGPLDLLSTRVELDGDLVARLAHGHDADGNLVSAWDLPSLAGAGGIRSTARDMATLLRAHLVLEPGPLAAAIRLAEKERVPMPEDSPVGGSAGLGWHVRPDGVRWHNGQTGGYASFVAYHRGSGAAVVLLVNNATWAVDELGFSLMAGLRGRFTPLDLPVLGGVDPALVARFAGTYGAGPARVTLVWENGRLSGRARGLPPFRLYPVSGTELALRVVRGSVVGEVDGAGRVKALVLRVAGRQVRVVRVPGS